MKKPLLKSAISLVAFALPLTANAQTDMTSVISNPDFEGTYVVAFNPQADRAIYQPNGWTMNYTDVEDNDITALKDGDLSWQAKFGTMKEALSTAGNQTYFVRERWGDKESIGLWQDVMLTAGKYKLTVDACHFAGSNSKMTVYVNDSVVTVTPGATWQKITINFELAADGAARIGFACKQNKQEESIFGIDNFKLFAVTVDKSALEKAIEVAKVTNSVLANETLTAAIATAEAENANTSATEASVASAVTELETTVKTVLAAVQSADFTSLIKNHSFETGNMTGWIAFASSDWGAKPNSNGTYTTTGVDGNYLFNTWDNAATDKFVKQTLNNLPEGYYKLTALAASDKDNPITIFAGANSVIIKGAEEGKGLFVEDAVGPFKLTAGSSLEIGATSQKWYKVDNFRLTYYISEEVQYKADYQIAFAAAQAAITNDANSPITGNERNALANALANYNNITTGYVEATTALNEATATFLAALESYTDYVNEAAYAGTLNYSIVEAVEAPKTAAEAVTAVQAIKVGEFNYIKQGYPNDITKEVIGAWDNNATASGQHWNGTGVSYPDSWSGNAENSKFEQTITLPKGYYTVMCAGRGQAGARVYMKATIGGSVVSDVSFVTKNDVGLGITVNGYASFSADSTYANGNNGRGWEWRYMRLYLPEQTDVTLSLCIDRPTGGLWGSFSNPTILTSEEFEPSYTVSEVPAKGWGTICLPFMAKADTNAVVYSVVGVNADSTGLLLSAVETMKPGFPYIYNVKEGATEVKFNRASILGDVTEATSDGALKGVFDKSAITLVAGNYVMIDSAWYCVENESDVTLENNSAYLTELPEKSDATDCVVMPIAAVTTGINAVNADKVSVKNGIVYNLNGQRVNGTAKKGVFIVNGKKVIM